MADNARRTTSERIREKNREIRVLFRERQIRCDNKDKWKCYWAINLLYLVSTQFRAIK